MKTNFLSLGLVGVAIWAFAPSSGKAQIIIGNSDTDGDTVQVDSGNSSPNEVYALGEAFAAPSTTMTSYTLTLAAGGNATEVDTYIAAWNGGVVNINNALFSTTQVITGSASTYTFNTGNLSLTPGTEYVAFIVEDSSPTYAAGAATASTSANPPDGVMDLGMVADMLSGQGGAGTGDLTADTWTSYSTEGNGSDALTFQGDFSPVPESSTFTIAGLGLCLALALYYHQRRKPGSVTAGLEAAA